MPELGVGGEAASISLRVIAFGPVWGVRPELNGQKPGKAVLTKVEVPIFRFPREEARKTLHLVAADLVTVNVVVVAVTERPQVVRVVFSPDLTKSLGG